MPFSLLMHAAHHVHSHTHASTSKHLTTGAAQEGANIIYIIRWQSPAELQLRHTLYCFVQIGNTAIMEIRRSQCNVMQSRHFEHVAVALALCASIEPIVSCCGRALNKILCTDTQSLIGVAPQVDTVVA